MTKENKTGRDVAGQTTLVGEAQHEIIGTADETFDSLHHWHALNGPHTQDEPHQHPFWKLVPRQKFTYALTMWKFLVATLLAFPAIFVSAPVVNNATPLGEALPIILWAVFACLYFRRDYKTSHQRFLDSVELRELLSVRAATVERFLKHLNSDFFCTIYSVTLGGDSAIAIDENLRVLRIYKFDFAKSPAGYVYTFEDIPVHKILESSVLVNDEVVNISGAQTVMNSVIGGVLAGGVGAIVGAIAGIQSTSLKVIHSIKLELLADDIRRPKVQFDFLTHAITAPTIFDISLESIFAKSEAEKIYNAIRVLLVRHT